MQAGVVPGEGSEVVRYPADEILLRAVGLGNVQVIEYNSTDHDGSPPHKHEWDEIEIVVDGEAEFRVGDEVVTGARGTVQMLPAGVPHAVRIPRGTARIIMVTIGPPYDGFAREMARLQAEGAPLEQIAETAGRFGVTLA
jgi:quercetin dioxygenase-like cupin family protein